MTPDFINALFELGSAAFGVLNVRAIRRSHTIAGVHWLPTAYFFVWGIWNLYFYPVLGQWFSLVAGIAITLINLIWLGHVFYYGAHRK